MQLYIYIPEKYMKFYPCIFQVVASLSIPGEAFMSDRNRSGIAEVDKRHMLYQHPHAYTAISIKVVHEQSGKVE
jgi:hypothetical protein